MKIAVCSDLHLEFGDYDITNTDHANVLILSGDIMVARKPNQDFLKRAKDQFEHVIYIAGNHEFYGSALEKAKVTLNTMCQQLGVVWLDDTAITINNVKFFGATLWTDMQKQNPHTMYACAQGMNDYRTIRVAGSGYSRLRPQDTVDLHLRSIMRLKEFMLHNKDSKLVVCTHHLPLSLSVPKEYVTDSLTPAYYSDLSELMLDNPQCVLWTHGHTHQACDYMFGTTRVVCNPRGYVGYEYTHGYEPKIVEI